MVLEVLDLDPNFLKHFPVNGFFYGLTRLDEPREGAVEISASMRIFCEKDFIVPVDQHNDGRG